MAVKFNFQTTFPLSTRRKLKQFIPLIFQIEKKPFKELTIVFCDDSYLLQINKQFLNHDFYTDIITFDLSDPTVELITGELYIGVNMVKENALKFKTGFQEELYRVIFHGVLHLCGYNDKKKDEIALMRRMETKYLEMFHGEQI